MGTRKFVIELDGLNNDITDDHILVALRETRNKLSNSFVARRFVDKAVLNILVNMDVRAVTEQLSN